jgi:NADPH2:quinone reductase
MVRAIRIHETGGPEVLNWEEVDVKSPSRGEVRIQHTAVGLNFIDVYHRSGLYPVAELPAVIGMEGAGKVIETGEGVEEFQPGDRVAYAGIPMGSYSEERVIPSHRLVRLPDSVGDECAASMMLKGMTAQYLLRKCYPVREKTTLLFHAASGGVGLIACQWAKHLGATVIGTVGTKEKAELASSHGCDYLILYRDEDFVERVREITDGKGVDVVYDSVGADTFIRSMDCLRPMGMLVSFGQSSGPVKEFNTGLLAAKGSLYLTRPSLLDYTASREDLLVTAGELFGMVEKGVVEIEVNQSYPLKDAKEAHKDLEGRKTTGSTVLIP